MSEIKVNKISPRTACGTTTLGDSGDTFNLPSGGTLTIASGATINNNGTANNFGATGAVNWQTTVKTGDFTAVSGEGYFVNTTSGAITVTLPSSPSAGAVVGFKDYAKTWDTNNCTLNRNSEKIGGVANNATLSTEGLAVTLVYVDSTQGWLVTDDGLQSQANTNPYMVATGGTITTSGNDKIHTFTGPGTFTVCKAAACATDNLVSYVIVAAGGGGGNSGGGGAGAGGYREVKSPSSPYTASPLDGYPSSPNRVTVTAQAYPIVVGGGGTGSPAPAGGVTQAPSGGTSSFGGITSAGGAGGGTGAQCSATLTAGGSGGGGRANQNNAGAAGNTPSTTPAQGTAGGQGGPSNGGGGGGGATDPGTNGSGRFGGCGGDGASSEITGSAVVRGGGGGGGTDQGGPTPGSPGTGGQAGPGGGGKGGNGQPLGAPTKGVAGTCNTGGGGGGGTNAPGVSPNSGEGGNGGSGVVIIRYRYQ